MLKNLNLKWKISLILALVVVLVMISVSFITYNFTQNIMTEQINEKIAMITQSQNKEIIYTLERYNRTVESFSKSSSLRELLNLSQFYIKEGALIEDLSLGGWKNMFKERIEQLQDNNNFLEAAAFSYVTDVNGIKILDSRADDDSQIDKYLGEQMGAEYFKTSSSDSFKIIGGSRYILFNHPIWKTDAKEELLGYYVLAADYDLYYSENIENTDAVSSFSVFNQEGYILSDNNRSKIGEKTANSWYSKQIAAKVESGQRQKEDVKQSFEKLSDQYNLYIALEVPTEIIQGPVNRLRNILVIVALIGIIVLFIASYLLLKWQFKSLDKLVDSFAKLAEGQLNSDVLLQQEAAKNDEIGKLSQAFNQMVERFRDVLLNINQTSETVEESSTNLKDVSEEVGSVSTQVAQAINDVAEGAENQAKSVNRMNSGVKNLASDIEELKKSNVEVEQLAQDMKTAAAGGKVEINKVSEQMLNIKESIQNVAAGINNLEAISNEIDEILNIINNVAEQTNLLALNAAIEAARAGEAGRGFSVVADEIRELAEETVGSADKIRKLVKEVKEETNNASSKMDTGIKETRNGEKVVKRAENSFIEIEAKINNATAGIDSSMEIVKNINRYSDQIVAEIESIAKISETTSANTQEVAASSEEQNASVEELASLANHLAEMSAELNKLVNQFELKLK